MDDIAIGSPTDRDWHWIIKQHAETAWASLSSEMQQAVSIQEVGASLTEQIATLRAEHGATNQLFIAQSLDGTQVGYIWVEQVTSAFTGRLQAYILGIFVADGWRGRGIGALLMTQAEAWARQNRLERIGLSVAMHNRPASALYEQLGYKVETLRMFKKLE